MFKFDKSNAIRRTHKFLILSCGKNQNAIKGFSCLHYSTRNFYDILNVKTNCTQQEIRDAFAKLSKKFHPDTSKSGNSEQNALMFREIIAAYKILNKKSSRVEYDASLNENCYGTSTDTSTNNNKRSVYTNFEYEILRQRIAQEARQRVRPFKFYRDEERVYDYESQRVQPFFNNSQMFILLLALAFINSLLMICSVRARVRRLHDQRVEPEAPKYEYGLMGDDKVKSVLHDISQRHKTE